MGSESRVFSRHDRVISFASEDVSKSQRNIVIHAAQRLRSFGIGSWPKLFRTRPGIEVSLDYAFFLLRLSLPALDCGRALDGCGE